MYYGIEEIGASAAGIRHRLYLFPRRADRDRWVQARLFRRAITARQASRAVSDEPRAVLQADGVTWRCSDRLYRGTVEAVDWDTGELMTD